MGTIMQIVARPTKRPHKERGIEPAKAAPGSPGRGEQDITCVMTQPVHSGVLSTRGAESVKEAIKALLMGKSDFLDSDGKKRRRKNERKKKSKVK